jgi:hypothetical protein
LFDPKKTRNRRSAPRCDKGAFIDAAGCYRPGKWRDHMLISLLSLEPLDRGFSHVDSGISGVDDGLLILKLLLGNHSRILQDSESIKVPAGEHRVGFSLGQPSVGFAEPLIDLGRLNLSPLVSIVPRGLRRYGT